MSVPKKGRRRFTVDSLFEDTSPRAAGVRDLVDAKEIDVERISPDPGQPRQTFDQDALEELASSIRQEGVLQPIAVRYDGEDDHYVILHGERRWRAAQIAGLSSIPAIVREVPEERRLIHQLMENVVREDLNAVDRAAALRALKRQMDDAPWERVAEAVGIRRSRLFQLLSTEKLAGPVQDRIRAGELSEKQTRALQSLSTGAQQALGELILAGATDDEVREISRQLRADPSYEELDDDALTSRIQGMYQAARSAEPASGPEADQLVDALRDLTGIRELPEDRGRALQDVESELGPGDFDAGRLTDDVQHLGYRLSRVVAGESDATIAPRQLRALRRLIDLALKAQRSRKPGAFPSH